MRPVFAILILLLASAPAVAQDAAGEKAVDYEALIAAADAKLAAKQYDDAAKIYGQAVRLRTDAAEPLVGIARCLFRKALAANDPRGVQQAKVLLREARIRDAEWGGTWFFWGEISLAARDHVNAVNGFRGALAKEHRVKEARPLLARSLLWLGVDQARSGRVPYARVIETLTEARKTAETLAADESYPEGERADFARLRHNAMTNLAGVRQRGGELAAAEKILRELVALEPDDPRDRLNLGLLLSAAGKTDEAMAEFKKAVEVNEDPDWVEPLRPMGRVASVAGRVEEADGYLRTYVEKRREDPEGWRALGDHLLRHGKAEEAVAAYERSVELAPGGLLPVGGLVAALTEAGRETEAAKWARLLAVLRRERQSR